MIFIDADKISAPIYYQMCAELVKIGGVILVDNVLWRGDC